MATTAEIEAARAVLETFVKSNNVAQSKARAQLILEAAERARAPRPLYTENELMGRIDI